MYVKWNKRIYNEKRLFIAFPDGTNGYDTTDGLVATR